jgi:hypothetical protein
MCKVYIMFMNIFTWIFICSNALDGHCGSADELVGCGSTDALGVSVVAPCGSAYAFGVS